MAKYRLLILALFILYAIELVNSSKCDRTPVAVTASKSPSDGRFRLHIKSDPARYVPNEAYDISIEAIQRQSSSQSNTFNGFYLTVEKDFTDMDMNPLRPIDIRNAEMNVGRFEIDNEPSAKISDRCNNLVTHTTTVAVQSVQVRWIAPGNGSGCVVFKSTVIERRDVWFADDGPLSIKLCEDAEDSGDVQPLVLEKCEACHEAKYELTIERLWSKHTHPKDFPIGWDTKFGDVIGASHYSNFSVWSYGEHAIDGMATLASHGATEDLEKHLMANNEQIRTIIKARGIAHPDIYGQTHAVFRVDSGSHLISLASQIYPSPDWFIGVSALELCLSNGSWVQQKEMNLYPYDAGVDNGPTYTSPDQPTKPAEAIRRIKPNQPNDVRSPFYDAESKSMKPMAKLIITLQRLYDNNCNSDEATSDGEDGENEVEPQNDDDNSRGKNRARTPEKAQDDNHCKTSGWSDWSSCENQSCGSMKYQTRTFSSTTATANWLKANCKDVPLTKEEPCPSNIPDCNKQNDASDDGAPKMKDSDCESDWSKWSDCSKECGIGEMSRTREFKIRKNAIDCKAAFPNINLVETRPCKGNEECFGDVGETKPSAKKDCPVPDDFGKFSICSEGKCGVRVQVKDLSSLKKEHKQDQHVTKLMKLYNRVKTSKKKLNPEEYEMITIENEDHPCYGVELMNIEECDKDAPDPDCHPPCVGNPPNGICDESIMEPRWYFIEEKRECGIFTYRGCDKVLAGNSFESYDTCMFECENKTQADRFQSLSLVKHHTEVNSKIDCIVGEWKQKPCNATCSEDGMKWRYRTIIQNARNGGLPCPRTIAQMERCWKDCDDDSEEMFIKPSSTNGRAISSNKPRQQQQYQPPPTSTSRPIINSRFNQQKKQQQQPLCQYSEWSPWSPCSRTCGDYSVQIRARTVMNRANAHLCSERLEERACDVLPCMITRYNYRGYDRNY